MAPCAPSPHRLCESVNCSSVSFIHRHELCEFDVCTSCWCTLPSFVRHVKGMDQFESLAALASSMHQFQPLMEDLDSCQHAYRHQGRSMDVTQRPGQSLEPSRPSLVLSSAALMICIHHLRSPAALTPLSLSLIPLLGRARQSHASAALLSYIQLVEGACFQTHASARSPWSSRQNQASVCRIERS